MRTVPSCGWPEYWAATIRTAGVLLVGIPIVGIQLAYYYFRRKVFGVPMNGDWGEMGQCEVHRKGPNTWN